MTASNEQRIAARTIETDATAQGQRLDNFLIKTLRRVPRTRIYQMIRKGEVRINKKRIKPDYKLAPGDLIRIPPIHQQQPDNPAPIIAKYWLEQLESLILFENAHFIVINKPSGLAVHAGSGVDFGVIDIMRRVRPDNDIELVHRIDLDTSGCLLLARHRQALLALQHCFQNNSIVKVYTAMVKGVWPADVSCISYRLRKSQMSNGERRVYVDPAGQPARTLVLDRQTNGRCSLLTLQLLTGRTHQIRVHCQAQGHQIVGDHKYGDRHFNRSMRKQGIKRLMLHACRIELPQTAYNQEMVINAPVPLHFNLNCKN